MTDRPGAVLLPTRPAPPAFSVEFEDVDFGCALRREASKGAGDGECSQAPLARA